VTIDEMNHHKPGRLMNQYHNNAIDKMNNTWWMIDKIDQWMDNQRYMDIQRY
jgi:hypothetical protein